MSGIARELAAAPKESAPSRDPAATSPARHAWLLGTGSSPPPPIGIEFADACDLAMSVWRVLPVVAPRLFDWAGSGASETAAGRRVRDRLVSVDTFVRLQMTVLRRVTRALDEASVPFSLLKGTAVAGTAYESFWDRCGLDMDIAVPHGEARGAERIALELGFTKAQFDWDTLTYHPADLELR
ncbi:MAG: nucleotidyltransferase family protein, partial [Gemmatimonadetes bacterium]|nr:nucleotidyltransferase family protein [Gemmatimonadota bacterium]